MECRAGPDLSTLPILGGLMLLAAAASFALTLLNPLFAAPPIYSVGALTAVVGLLIIVVPRTVSTRRERALSAARPEQPSEWIGWVLSQRNGWWKGEVRGRTLVAQRAARRHGIGHVHVRLSVPIGTRATLIRRDADAVVGRALDRAAGAKVESAAALGYDGFETSAHEPAWFARLLGDEAVRGAVARLETKDLGAPVLAVDLSPGYVALRLGFPPKAEVDAEEASVWIDALFTIAEAMERIERPAEELAPTRLGALALDPAAAQRFARKLVLAFVGGGALIAALVVAAIVVLRAR